MAGRSILIIGGASGVGLSTATSFAESGAKVIIADVKPSTSTDELRGRGLDVHYAYCDTFSWESQVALFKTASEIAGPSGLTTIALFAAINDQPNLIDHVKATDHAVKPNTSCIDVNLTGVIYSATLALHHFKSSSAQNDRCLIIIASLAAYVDDAHNSTYTASKFGTRGLFRTIRARARTELGVRCNLIAPWAMKTPMTDPIMEKVKEFGIEEGKGVTFATHETLVAAVRKCVEDESVIGRAYAVVPEGFVDLGDDVAGGYGGSVLQEIMARRKADGDFLQG